MNKIWKITSPKTDVNINFGIVFSEINLKTHLGIRGTLKFIYCKNFVVKSFLVRNPITTCTKWEIPASWRHKFDWSFLRNSRVTRTLYHSKLASFFLLLATIFQHLNSSKEHKWKFTQFFLKIRTPIEVFKPSYWRSLRNLSRRNQDRWENFLNDFRSLYK